MTPAEDVRADAGPDVGTAPDVDAGIESVSARAVDAWDVDAWDAGDSACWLASVCPECGAMRDGDSPCPRCDDGPHD